ncbi:MAG: heme-binding protein [Pseudomonadota bacterium]
MAQISLSRARTIIAKAFAKGREMGLKPLSICVLDAGGHLKAFERQDGASNLRFQIAYGKANGALGLGIGSRAINARAEAQAYFVLAANGAFDGGLIPVPGGVLVKAKNGEILGAVGVTGDTSDNDEAAAIAGIEAVNLVADPG